MTKNEEKAAEFTRYEKLARAHIARLSPTTHVRCQVAWGEAQAALDAMAFIEERAPKKLKADFGKRWNAIDAELAAAVPRHNRIG